MRRMQGLELWTQSCPQHLDRGQAGLSSQPPRGPCYPWILGF